MNTTNFITATSRTDGDDDHYKLASERAASCAKELHYTLGLVTEAGEIADVYKKFIGYGKEPDNVNVKEEIGDLLWYVARFLELKDWTFEDVMRLNTEKLKARYPEKFTQEAAENRDLKAERRILENE